jgi:hypothetical protein
MPFAVPDSERPLNPMMPIGARGSQNGVNGNEAGFNNTDALGQPMAPIVNEMTNFYWEYVFHCHILSHEEMDMMRSQTVYVARELADAPVLTWAPGSVILSWTDGTPVTTDPATWGSPKAEIGYRVERAIGSGPWEVIGTTLANITTFTDPTALDIFNAFHYRVVAYNAAGDSVSNEITVAPPAPAAPDLLTVTGVAWNQVSLSWTDLSADEAGFRIERAPASGGVPTGPFASLGTVGQDVTSFNDLTVDVLTEYAYQVFAFNSGGDSAASNMAFATTPNNPNAPNAPSNAVLTLLGNITNPVNNPLRIRLVFFDNATNETGFVVERSVNGGPFAFLLNLPVRAGTGSVTNVDYAVSVGNTYAYRVKAVNGVWNSAWLTSSTISVAPPLAPSNFQYSAVVGCTNACAVVTLTWTDNANNESGFELQRATNAAFTTGFNQWTVGINVTSTQRNLNRNLDYWFRIRAVGNAGSSAWVTIGPFHTP